ncbi:hypothetical protein CsSME_00045887 [Camellia sinensis var. sinensis]
MFANQSIENNCRFMSCEKLDRMVNWVGMSVASAFFASLKRCACINLNTSHDDAENDEEAKDCPRYAHQDCLLRVLFLLEPTVVESEEAQASQVIESTNEE